MGNVCEIDSQCLQSESRERVRARSLSDSKENLCLKNFIQVKKISIFQEYTLEDPPIGRGSFGNVYKATNKVSKILRAVKRISKKKKSIESLDQFMILKRLDHPNIIRIYDIYIDLHFIYIVMDLCEGGQLFDRIIKNGMMTENEARHYMKQLLSAISNCHANKIMHRDLKPQNIMFLSSSNKDLKIIDFGVGTAYLDHQQASLKVGSIYYMAPEVIRKKYNEKCDVWSLGVILYILLSGRPPFRGKTDKIIYESILKGEIQFSGKIWNKVSVNAKDLIQKMLAYLPQNRLSAKEALNHKWIKMNNETGQQNLYVSSELQSIKGFCEMNQFQNAIMVYISHNLIQNSVLADLQLKFKKIDVNGDGKISWPEFRECYIENMPPTSQEKIKSIFETLDKNHSHFIDYSEFITSTLNKNYIFSENLVNKAFQMIDKDGNGFLTRQQLIEAFGGSKQELYQKIMIDFDLNKDGEISKAEFKEAMKGLMHR